VGTPCSSEGTVLPLYQEWGRDEEEDKRRKVPLSRKITPPQDDTILS